MALTKLLTFQPFNITKTPKFNFPPQNSTPLQKSVVNPKHNFQTLTTTILTRFLTSSLPQDFHKKLQFLASESQTSIQSPKMGREIANRRFAMLMLLSMFIAASSPVFAASSEVNFIKKTVSSHTIVIFSKSYCPYCRRAKEVFKELNQAPHVIELDERDDAHSIQDALSGIVGRRTVPQVFINGKHVGGSDETVEAYQNGELAKLLGIEPTDHDDL